MISTLKHIVSLGKIPVAIIVLCAFLLGQFVEVWHYHSPSPQSSIVNVDGATSAETSTSHDSCAICSTSQFFKDFLSKPVTSFFTILTHKTVSFTKQTLYFFISSVLRPSRAPPAF